MILSCSGASFTGLENFAPVQVVPVGTPVERLQASYAKIIIGDSNYNFAPCDEGPRPLTSSDKCSFKYSDFLAWGGKAICYAWGIANVNYTWFHNQDPVPYELVPNGYLRVSTSALVQISDCEPTPLSGVWFNSAASGSTDYQVGWDDPIGNDVSDPAQHAGVGIPRPFGSQAQPNSTCTQPADVLAGLRWHGEVTQSGARAFIPFSVRGKGVSKAWLTCPTCQTNRGSFLVSFAQSSPGGLVTYSDPLTLGSGLLVTVPSDGRILFPEGIAVPSSASLSLIPSAFTGTTTPVGDTKQFNLNALGFSIPDLFSCEPGTPCGLMVVDGYSGDGSDITMSCQDSSNQPCSAFSAQYLGSGKFMALFSPPGSWFNDAATIKDPSVITGTVSRKSPCGTGVGQLCRFTVKQGSRSATKSTKAIVSTADALGQAKAIDNTSVGLSSGTPATPFLPLPAQKIRAK